MVSRVSSLLATWFWLVLLLSIHLATNYAAVRAVKMRTLNRQRACLVLSTLIDNGLVLSPEQVSAMERIFERDGILRWKGSTILGHARIGVTLRVLLASLGDSHSFTRSIRTGAVTLFELDQIYKDQDYILWCDEQRKEISIVLKDRATAVSQLKAWAHGLRVARRIKVLGSTSDKSTLELRNTWTIKDIICDTLDALDSHFDKDVQDLKAAGWDVDAAALVTRPAFHISKSTGPSR